jgi:anti-sigma factor RsiW
MKCEEVLSRLDEHVDGELHASDARRMEDHLETCTSCRQQERRLRELLDQAARLPKEVAPPRDLWPGILGRLPARPSRVTILGLPWLPALAAAAALVAVSSALTAFLMRGERNVGPAVAAVPMEAEAPRVVPAAVEEATSSLRGVEAEYERAAQALLTSLDQRGEHLSPETLRVVDQNLRAIDAALDQVRQALAKDPGNAGLIRMLAATHQKKIDVLQRVVRHRNALIG